MNLELTKDLICCTGQSIFELFDRTSQPHTYSSNDFIHTRLVDSFSIMIWSYFDEQSRTTGLCLATNVISLYDEVVQGYDFVTHAPLSTSSVVTQEQMVIGSATSRSRHMGYCIQAAHILARCSFLWSMEMFKWLRRWSYTYSICLP